MKFYKILQNARVTAFIVSELLTENQQGLNLPPPPTTTTTTTHPPRLGLILRKFDTCLRENRSCHGDYWKLSEVSDMPDY